MKKEIVKKILAGQLVIMPTDTTYGILFLKNDLLSKHVSLSEYVAIRIPNNENLREIIRLSDKPIVATSANISGDEVITNIQEITPELKKEVPDIYDGGTLSSIPSTLIKVVDEKITFLREESLTSQIKEDFIGYF